MKMKQVHAPLVMAVISALVNVASPKPTARLTKPGPHGLNLNWKKFTLSRYSGAPNTTTKRPYTTTTAPSTRGPHGLNLNGKMFTLSSYSGGVSFYPPSWPSTPSYTTSPYYTNTSPYTTKRPYTTTKHYPTTTERPYPTTMHYPTTSKRPYTTTERPYTTTKRPYITTTAPSTRGVSVCLRYLTDYVQTSNPRIFTLSPSSSPVQVYDNQAYGYTLISYGYNRLDLKPSISFWSNIGPDIWSRVCLTLDSMKNVAQVFSGSNISIRKVIPDQFVWSGEPVIEFTGFDGQVTDVQVWDYPLSYREVFNYMTSGVHGPYQGSVLTWSSISYSPRGDALLEDVYEWQAKQQISWRRGSRPKGEKKARKFINVDKREEGKGNQL